MIPEVPRPHRHGSDGRREIRRGLLYMLLAAGIYYFAGGYYAIKLPVTIVPAVTTYLSPFLFFCGAGLKLLGILIVLWSVGCLPGFFRSEAAYPARLAFSRWCF